MQAAAAQTGFRTAVGRTEAAVNGSGLELGNAVEVSESCSEIDSVMVAAAAESPYLEVADFDSNYLKSFRKTNQVCLNQMKSALKVYYRQKHQKYLHSH